MRVITDLLARQDTAAVAVATLLGSALALYVLQSLASRRTIPDKTKATGKLHLLPTRNAVLGDLLEFARNAPRLHEWIAETSLAFGGEPWRAHIPGIQTMIVVTTQELVEEVMTTQFDTFQHGESANEISESLVGKAIATVDGEMWYHQRKAASRFFTTRSLRTCMTTQMRKNMTQVYNVIDSATARGQAVDMLHLFHEFALQTFTEIGLGIDLNVIGSTEDHPMSHGIELVTPMMVRRASLPRFYWKLERWMNVGPEGAAAAALQKVYVWLDEVIAQSLAIATARQAESLNPTGGKPEAKDDIKSVVELFLEQSDEDKAGMTARDLRDFILQFILGARGTSALSLAWIFLLIAKHPEVDQRIRDEMAVRLPEIMADDEAYVTSDHIQDLVYLEATIKEVLRLYPTIPMNRREAMKDTVIGDGIPVKKGEFVVLHPYAMARLPSLWGPDAAEFKPERWIDPTTGELIKVSSTKFLLFGSGPRTCIGMKLAMLEMRVVTANLIKRYQFSLAAPNDCSHVVSMDLMLANPLVMSAKRTTKDIPNE
jgi:cytochrome P450